MLKLQITIVIVAGCLCGGCLEMVTPGDVTATQAGLTRLTVSLDAYQRTVGDMAGQLARDKLISAKTAADVNSINAKIDELQPVLSDAVKAVLAAEYSGDKVGDVITGVQAANAATAAINPYAPLVDAGTKLLLGLLGVGTAGGVYVAKKKSAEAADGEMKAAESQAKYNAHKQATELLKMAHPEIAAELYAKVGDARAKLGI